MRVEDPIKFFGCAAAAARAIGYQKPCFKYWRDKRGGIITERAALLLVHASGGKLDFGLDDYIQSPGDNHSA